MIEETSRTKTNNLKLCNQCSVWGGGIAHCKLVIGYIEPLFNMFSSIDPFLFSCHQMTHFSSNFGPYFRQFLTA